MDKFVSCYVPGTIGHGLNDGVTVVESLQMDSFVIIKMITIIMIIEPECLKILKSQF